MQYLIRLDDFCEYMDVEKWERVKSILKKENITALVGIIPKCKDPDFVNKYKKDEAFWERAKKWQDENCIFGLHGYEHVFKSNSGGINPVQNYSEFAGLSLEKQKEKIAGGYKILTDNGIDAKVFFAPAHTFDINTLLALKSETPIRIISDTVANNIYKKHDFYFLPQQSGKCRKLPFKFTTIALHPNNMTENDFQKMENFVFEVAKNRCQHFIKNFEQIKLKENGKTFYDNLLSFLYFLKRRISKVLKS